jgi:hypothetical protein
VAVAPERRGGAISPQPCFEEHTCVLFTVKPTFFEPQHIPGICRLMHAGSRRADGRLEDRSIFSVLFSMEHLTE